MKFEQFPQPEQEHTKDSGVESRFDRYMRKAKYLAKIGLCVGTLTMGGLAVKQGIESRRDYRNYYEEKTPETDKERYKELRQKLIDRLGEKAVKGIEFWNRSAFWERRDAKETEIKPPDIKGFDAIDLDHGVLEKLWSEQNGSYPKGWVNGEVKMVEYVGESRGVGNNFEKKTQAAAQADPLLRHITMFKTLWPYSLPVFRFEARDAEFGHEVGHLNDWESDRDLSLLERAELLSKIADRMRSEHPYRSLREEANNKNSYYQGFHSENKEEENYLQAKEYWGDLCGGYFAMPEWVKEKYPEDYAIVDGYVKKTDPTFNPVRAEEQRDSLILEAHFKNSVDVLKTDK